VLSAGAGEVASARYGDSPRRNELGDDGIGETRHRVGQEHGLRADADKVPTFGEGRDELAV